MVPTFALPPHFAAEARRLAEAGITSWQQLADLDAPALRQLGRAGGASEARLLRLQGQARLLLALELPPAAADPDTSHDRLTDSEKGKLTSAGSSAEAGSSDRLAQVTSAMACALRSRS